MKSKPLIILLLLFICLSPSSYAAYDDSGDIWFFGGLDLGSFSVSPEGQAGEFDKDGLHFGVRATLSYYYNPDWVLDGTIGYMRHEIESDLVDNTQEKIENKLGFLEVNPKFRLHQNFHLGTLLNFQFGGSLLTGANEESESNLMWGLNGVYELHHTVMGKFRFGVTFAKSTSIGDRSGTLLMLNLAFGLPVRSSYQEIPPEKKPETIYVESPEPDYQEVVLEDNIISFKLGSAKLNPESQDILRRAAMWLVQNLEQWNKILIEGHTDKTGRFDTNMRLSVARAKAVRTEFIKAGVPSERLETGGFGYTRPIDDDDTPDAYARNRRVVLKFYGVDDPDRLQELVEGLL